MRSGWGRECVVAARRPLQKEEFQDEILPTVCSATLPWVLSVFFLSFFLQDVDVQLLLFESFGGFALVGKGVREILWKSLEGGGRATVTEQADADPVTQELAWAAEAAYLGRSFFTRQSQISLQIVNE